MRQSAKYQSLFDNLNDAVYIVDLTTSCFTSVNRAGERLTGYSEKELKKRRFIEVVAPEYIEVVKEMVAKKTDENVSTVYEVEIVRKDGVRLPVEISSRALYKMGKPFEILGVARDISERHQHERQREIFISLITHEIKNPLTSLQVYTDLLRRLPELKKTPAEKHLLTMKQQIQSISSLMNDFLEVNKLQLGEFRIHKEKFDMNSEIKKIIASFPREKNTPHIVQKGTLRKKVSGDKTRLMQVLTNFISNALKYAHNSEKIIVQLEESTKEVTVKVEDSGQGIAKAEQEHIFDLFYRTESSQKSDVRGHGLGLYISREIIRSHKGKIWVESETGKGATFAFRIPRE